MEFVPVNLKIMYFGLLQNQPIPVHEEIEIRNKFITKFDYDYITFYGA